jgi:UDP-N-acetylglucosamine 2-epimerase (non-hydrolysing)
VVPRRKILFIFGTRPEAIKLSPVIERFRSRPDEFDARICVTAQHREMLDQVLGIFQITPHYDLNIMRRGQTLAESAGSMLLQLAPVLRGENPDMVLVQGDTTSTLCGALAAFYAGIPVGHVEAGLRTGDIRAPFPEEMNRVVVSRLSALHFAATPWAARNLAAEGVPEHAIVVTGNSGIDAVLYTRDRLIDGRLAAPEWPNLDPARKLVLVTAHRRESFGPGFDRICEALRRISRFDGVEIVYPVHPNPRVAGTVRRILGAQPHVHLIEPLDYVSFVDLMRRAYLLLTDSGGVQEEAPSLGKPALVMREKTERPEALEAGTAELVGTDVEKIVATTEWLIRDRVEYERRAKIQNPYGDGQASARIVAAVRVFFAELNPAYAGPQGRIPS